MQKKHILSPLFALIILSSLVTPLSTTVYSASPSPAPSLLPSPTPSNSTDAEATENIKKRLQETIGDQSNDLLPINKYKSFVGIIRDVIKDTLILEDKDGKKSIKIASGSAIVRSPGNTTIKTDSIRIDDYAIAIGNLLEDDELESVRLIVSTNPLTTSNKQVNLVKITKITNSTLTVIPISSGETKTITLSTKSNLKTALGESLDSKDLSVGDSILYTASVEKDKATVTTLMRIGFASPEASAASEPTDN